MDSSHGKMKMNVESDRLSSLPDDLIHNILSFIDIREAIGTGVLSSRWRLIWTSLPYLNFSIRNFSALPKFSKFVSNVLSRRSNLAEVYSMKLRIRVKESLLFVKRILKYAFSHNIQHLDVVFELEKATDSLISLFSSQPLKYLSLTMEFDMGNMYIPNDCFAPTSGLPTLTSLELHYISSRNSDKWISFFSKCENMKNLTLKQFNLFESSSLSICHPQLSNVTLDSIHYGGVVTIDAPQLKNLTIKSCNAKCMISAPVLASLLYNGYSHLPQSTGGFHSLEKADICFSYSKDKDFQGLVSLLQLFHNVRFLTLNLGIIEALSSPSMDLNIQQPSPFVNLKSLKICPESSSSYEPTPKEVTTLSTKVKSYLLGGSPDSTLTIVFREEVRAQELMAHLRVCLDKEKGNYKTYRALLKQGKTPVESDEPKKLETGGNKVQIKSGWEDLVQQLQQRIENGCGIMSKLHSIEDLLIKLPPSNRTKILPSFCSLYEEVDTAISMITDFMKIQCDEKSKLFKSLLS